MAASRFPTTPHLRDKGIFFCRTRLASSNTLNRVALSVSNVNVEETLYAIHVISRRAKPRAEHLCLARLRASLARDTIKRGRMKLALLLKPSVTSCSSRDPNPALGNTCRCLLSCFGEGDLAVNIKQYLFFLFLIV